MVEETECENSLAFVCVGVDSTGLYAQWRHEEPLGLHGCWVRESSTVNSVATHQFIMFSSKFREKEQTFLPKEFLRFSREIAAGMAHLSQKSFVHRDLAARNILLDVRMSCKARQEWPTTTTRLTLFSCCYRLGILEWLGI